jgi:outer membrane protein insertion porin family
MILALGGALAAPRAAAQSAPLTLVDDDTEVRSIRFRYTDTRTLEPARLREQIALTPRGRLYGLRRTLGFLPFISPAGVHPFSPVELARDAVRIERYYARNGFLFADVDWLVRLDSARNVVNVLFTVAEGPPLLLESLDYRGPDGERARASLDESLHAGWEAFRRRSDLQTGERFDEFSLILLEDEALRWVRNRGYAFAEVRGEARIDSVENRARVTINLDPGPRARIGDIQVEGNERVRDQAILRELPFREGDMFSQRRLVAGQREVFSLNIFQIALADVPEQPVDSTVTVLIRVREAPPRVVSAQTGYLSEGGVTGQASWTHRNFLGDARTFTAAAVANTGLAAFAAEPDRRYRGSVTLRQPYVFNRHFGASGTAFAEFRDDVRDRSRAFGGDASLLYERGQFRTATLTYRFEDRRVQEFRFGTGGAGDLVSIIEEQLNIAEGFETNLSRSLAELAATYGDVDDPLNPRRGYIVRPAAQITLPFPASALEYGRLRVAASAYYPFGDRITLAARAGVGRLYPFGERPEEGGESFTALLRLRDVVLLGGGPTDVRGWPPGRLGPKALDLLVREDAEGGPEYTAPRYYPYGGTASVNATAEARYGITELLGAFAFADAGRVWTPDAAYRAPTQFPIFDGAFTPDGDLALDEDTTDRWFYGVGGGVSIASPIGAIQLALGVKVNPSFFDLRAPQDIADALQGVFRANPDPPLQQQLEAVRAIPASNWRRLHVHLSIGQTF